MSARSLPTNIQVADAFDLLADLLEIDGERSRHRLLAYRRGAARIRAVPDSVARMALDGRATDLPDIGATLQDKIAELTTTGSIAALDRVSARVPPGLADIARLTGIGPKRAAAVWRDLGVTDLASLAAAAADGRLAGVAGIGPKTVRSIADELAERAERGGVAERVPIGRAMPVADRILADLRDCPAVADVAIAGGLRRGAETVHDIDLVVVTDEPETVTAWLRDLPVVTELRSSGAAGAAVMTQSGIRVEVRYTGPDTFGNLLQHLTGSKAHNVRLRELAVRRGRSVSEHGITDADGRVLRAREESEVYAALGLQYIPPELREDSGEIAVAQADAIPDLVTEQDLRGDLHMHTDWSDGRNTLREMVLAAKELGLEYIAISDHSVSLAMAGGLDADRVRRQWDEIDRVRDEVDGITVLRGCEVDVLADGRLDHPDDLLEGFDWVTASLHSGFRQPSDELTKRVLAAIDHPLVDAIGHPTGRMFGRREGYTLDLDRVLARAAETGTALEINAQPKRLDLRADHARRALAAGVRLTIGTDAHSVDELRVRRYGILTARRAGATPDRVVNCAPLAALPRRRRA